jgi:sugar phosphate isomerase/epimerase
MSCRSAKPLADLSRLCIHTITTKPWGLEEAVGNYSKAGVSGITVWRDVLDNRNISDAGNLIRNSGLEVVSLCRGGFFPALTVEGRKEAVQSNMRLIDEAAELGAPLIVLVCGAVPGIPLEESRKQIADGISEILPHAESNRVRLGIEPLHPMYADCRSAINTLAQANSLCEALGSEYLGVAVDVYHLWWDPALKDEIRRCGESKKLFAFHISDWRTPTADLLNDRGLMGEGCIPIRDIRGWVEEAGFEGYNEVEIFSLIRWAQDQKEYLSLITKAYLKHS